MTECAGSSDQLGSRNAEDDLKVAGSEAVDTDLAGSPAVRPEHPWYVYSQIVAREARLCRSAWSRAGRGW